MLEFNIDIQKQLISAALDDFTPNSAFPNLHGGQFGDTPDGKLTVTLTDAMGMLPQMKLSSARRVFVGARISRSGQAIAQSGDLEGDAGVIAVDSKTPVKIVIDRNHG